MKNTCFLSMLAAALLGGQVFAAPTGTAVEGYDTEHSTTDKYYGTYSDTESATGGNVTIKADEQGDVPNNASVYGGCSTVADASGNTLTMQGGTVGNIRGGYAQTEGDSDNNTVIMKGGSVNILYGGNAGNNYSASNNVVIVTGGSISTALSAGYANGGAMNNKLHLVGMGASNVSIADAQGSIGTYSGGNGGITLKNVFGGYAASGNPSTGNSIDIYGTGIKISGRFSYMQVLTFNITNAQMAATSPEVAVNHTSTAASSALNLTGVDLQIKDLDVQAWTPGKTITLVQASQEITGLGDGKEVDITDATGAKVAQGKLQLVDAPEGKHLLTLTIQGNVPEPTTVTLTMLALAGLCARRRKK